MSGRLTGSGRAARRSAVALLAALAAVVPAAAGGDLVPALSVENRRTRWAVTVDAGRLLILEGTVGHATLLGARGRLRVTWEVGLDPAAGGLVLHPVEHAVPGDVRLLEVLLPPPP